MGTQECAGYERRAYLPAKRNFPRILRSVFFGGGRSSYDWLYACSRDQQQLEKIKGKIISLKIVRLVVAITIDRTINRGPRRSIVRSIVEFCDR